MMHKLLLTTHWTAEEAETILAFLDALREVLLIGYEVDISQHHQSNTRDSKDDLPVTENTNKADDF